MKNITVQKIDSILRKHKAQLLTKANVVGVGIAEKIQKGLSQRYLSLKVYVEKKVVASELKKDDIIPQTLLGAESDVEEVGKIVALSNTGRYRPALGGVSIGHYKITAGTFGCLVKGKKDGYSFILSNNHVLANSNQAKRNDAILQPGPYDGGRKSKDTLARLERWIEIKFGKEYNSVDAALARLKDNTLAKTEILEIGLLSGIGKAKRGISVQKSGRTSGYTTGKIKDVNATVKVQYDQQTALFENQILTTAMSQGGDSGSLVLDTKKRAVGLLFAGSNTVTICNPILEVLRLLEADILF